MYRRLLVGSYRGWPGGLVCAGRLDLGGGGLRHIATRRCVTTTARPVPRLAVLARYRALEGLRG
jgi:hypothetical protein